MARNPTRERKNMAEICRSIPLSDEYENETIDCYVDKRDSGVITVRFVQTGIEFNIIDLPLRSLDLLGSFLAECAKDIDRGRWDK
jgi:hypothetical protein